ncbi:MAG: hypothetical protein IPO15_20890 [Anaerolineae bacterium]|uniref:hypothetical protein n=1 Tax=Candidatus Amarolinea dominans TaxID=3140696 RepID=UPI0031374D8D|nr:hypothetical protein [Anaerolineae bacterium]
MAAGSGFTAHFFCWPWPRATPRARTYAETGATRAFLGLLSDRTGNPAALGEPLTAAAIQAHLPAAMLLLVYFNTNAPARFLPVADWLRRYQPALSELLFRQSARSCWWSQPRPSRRLRWRSTRPVRCAAPLPRPAGVGWHDSRR